MLPDADEEEVVRLSVQATMVLWGEGYRRVDNSSEDFLQDEIG